MSDESGLDIFRNYPFTHAAHNRRFSVSDVFLLTGNTQFGLGEVWLLGRVCRRQDMMANAGTPVFMLLVYNLVINKCVSSGSLNLLDNFGIGSYWQKFQNLAAIAAAGIVLILFICVCVMVMVLKWPKYLNRPLVAGCSIGHKASSMLVDWTWDKQKTLQVLFRHIFLKDSFKHQADAQLCPYTVY